MWPEWFKAYPEVVEWLMANYTIISSCTVFWHLLIRTINERVFGIYGALDCNFDDTEFKSLCEFNGQ